MHSIRTRLLLTLVPIALVLLCALGYLNYIQTTEIVSGSTREHLNSMIETRQAALIEHIRSTEKIASSLAATGILQSYVELANRELRGRNQEALEKLGDGVQDLLYGFQEAHWGRYRHIYLVNRSNRIVVSPAHGLRQKGSPSTLIDRDMSRNRWAMEAMNRGVTTISDYVAGDSSDGSMLMLFYPVRDSANRIQAVIGIELQATYQQKIVNGGIDGSGSERVFLATARGVPLDHKGVANGAPLTGDAVNTAKLQGIGSERRTDADGRDMISVYAHHSDYPWILVAEIDSAEVFAVLHRLHLVLAAGISATLVLITLLLLRFANSIVHSIREAISHIERISRGELDLDILDPSRKDETGQLIEALQRLMLTMQLIAKKLRSVKAYRKAG